MGVCPAVEGDAGDLLASGTAGHILPGYWRGRCETAIAIVSTTSGPKCERKALWTRGFAGGCVQQRDVVLGSWRRNTHLFSVSFCFPILKHHQFQACLCNIRAEDSGFVLFLLRTGENKGSDQTLQWLLKALVTWSGFPKHWAKLSLQLHRNTTRCTSCFTALQAELTENFWPVWVLSKFMPLIHLLGT